MLTDSVLQIGQETFFFFFHLEDMAVENSQNSPATLPQLPGNYKEREITKVVEITLSGATCRFTDFKLNLVEGFSAYSPYSLCLAERTLSK